MTGSDGSERFDSGPVTRATAFGRSRRSEPRVLDARAARLVAADLLSRRPWTRAELTARLRRRGTPTDVAIDVVADLSARGHLDDAAFARQWIETRAVRGYGAKRLRSELHARGIEPGTIDAALGALVQSAELDAARAAARRRLPALQRAAPERIGSRLHDYLLRRGYPTGVALRVVRELTGVGAIDEGPGD